MSSKTSEKELQRRFAWPTLHKLRQIAVDEISIGKGHRYLTVILDLKSGAVIFVGDGKGAAAGSWGCCPWALGWIALTLP